MANGTGSGTLTPTRKVGVGLAGGVPMGIVVVWLLQAFVLPANKPMPLEVATAIGALCSFVVSYFIPNAKTNG